MCRLFGVTLAVAVIASSLPARAQETSASYVVSYIEAASSGRAAALRKLKALRDSSRKEAGNNGYEVLQRIGQPAHFAILEIWKDGKALAAHTAATAASRDKLKPTLIAPTDERPSTGYAVGALNAAGGGAVYALTHVDLIGAKKDEGIAAVKQLSLDSAKEPGNLRYDIWQQGNRPNHLTVIEVWRDKTAFAKHEVAAHTLRFRDTLAPMSGSLYDQRLYQAIK
jgi:quinol monooxygenase YgiN